MTLPDGSERSVTSVEMASRVEESSERIASPGRDRRTSSYRNARGFNRQNELDEHSQITRELDDLGRETFYERDNNSLATKITRPNGSVINKTYDALGNTTSTTEGFNGATMRYEYNQFSQVTKYTNARKDTYTITRDTAGNPIEIEDPLGLSLIHFSEPTRPERIS